MQEYNAVYVNNGEWWIAWVEEIPGANTQGKTLEEAKENLRDAVSLILESNREIQEKRIANKAVVREQLTIA